MPLKVNPITGVLDLVGVTTTSGDARYLRLDASNDPVTGYLSILERLGIAELEPADRFNVNSVGDIIAKGISSVVLNMKSATALKVEAENINDDVFVVDTKTPLVNARYNIHSPSLDKSFKTQSYIPVVTADNYETPFYFERATAALTTPTSDATGDCLHPDVVYIPGSWNGYRHWMVMTPFANANAQIENPEILVSNDGTTWIVPPGGTNPISPNPGGGIINHDPCLMFDNNTLYCYWGEYLIGKGDIIRMKSSTDGITWTTITTVLDAGGTQEESLSSPIVRNINGTYYLWAVDTFPAATVIYRYSSTSPSGPFTGATACTLTTGVIYPFHINILWDGDAYYMIFKRDGVGELYFARSYDGLLWDVNGVEVKAGGGVSDWDEVNYQSCLIRRPNQPYFDVFYSAYDDATPDLHRIGRGKLFFAEQYTYGYADTNNSRYVTFKESPFRVDSTTGAFFTLTSRTAGTAATDDPRIIFQHLVSPSNLGVIALDTSDVGAVGWKKMKFGASSLASTVLTCDFGVGIVIGCGQAATDYTLIFDGETNDGTFTWMEDEDYFLFADDIQLPDSESLKLGTASDATITFDGNSLNIISNAVTTTDAMEFTAGSYSFNVPANTDIVTNWVGTTKSGIFTWLEDEGAFQITSTPLSTAWNNLVISDTTALAAGVGGGIIFQGYWTGTSLTSAAGIKMAKTNSTDTDYSFGLDFYTRLNGSALAKSWTMKNSGELLQTSPTNTVVAAYTGLTVNQKYNPASNDAANETGGASLKATVAGSSNAFNVTGALAWALYSGTGRVTGTIQGLNGYAQIASGAAAGTTAVLRAGNYAIDNSDADTIVTRASGLEIVTPVNAGTFTNTYGLYIFSQTAGTQTNLPWGIWDDGNNWAMDGDNAKFYQGEGQDVYCTFDGSDWLFDISGATADAGTSDFIFKLKDAAGASHFYVNDNADEPLLNLDSLGNCVFTSVAQASYFQTSTAPTANSTGTVVIVAKDAGVATSNSGWLPLKKNDGTVVYVPIWN